MILLYTQDRPLGVLLRWKFLSVSPWNQEGIKNRLIIWENKEETVVLEIKINESESAARIIVVGE